MAVNTIERIPPLIRDSLDPRYRTEYHFPLEWHFDLSVLKPAEADIVDDLGKLFRSGQRWTPEAVATSRGSIRTIQRYGLQDDITSPITPITTIRIGLHTEAQVPTRSVWFLKPIHRRTFLDLNQVLIDGMGEEERYGFKHEIFISHDLPNLGLFGSLNDLEISDTPYFIKALFLRPFYYTDPGNPDKITGEDITRMFLDVDLRDGRILTQEEIDKKTKDYNMELSTARTNLGLAEHRLRYLQAVTENELTGRERALLEKLNSRPDPLRQ